MSDYYELMEIRRDATITEIKLAYKRLIHKYHPDVNKNREDIEKFKMVIKAYKVLTSPVARLEYDKTLPPEIINGEKKGNSIKATAAKQSRKMKFIFSNIFNKKKLENFFINVKKTRAELRRKKFVERERSKLVVNEKMNFYDEMTEVQLIARLRSSSNHFVRASAAKVIGKKRDRKYFLDLVRALSDTSSVVRKEVVKSLGLLRDFRAVNFLVNSVHDYDNEVREEVAKSLRNFEDTRAEAALLKLINDKNEIIVSEAIYSLGVIGDKDILPEIRDLLKHPSIKVKRAALEVIRILR